MDASNSLVLAKGSVALALSGNGDPKEAARRLLALSTNVRAMTLASTFGDAVDQLPPKEATDGAERLGHNAEQILDELPNDVLKETVTAMIEAGDSSFVLSMLRGNASDISTVAQFLTPDLLEELFTKDADLAGANLLTEKPQMEERTEGEAVLRFRTLSLVVPLLQNPTQAILLFLANNEVGRQAMTRISDLAALQNEDAQYLLSTFRSHLSDLVLEEDEDFERFESK